MNWQYKTIVLPSSEQRENMLTEMGLNGWELVGFEQGLAYFKRPKSESAEYPAPNSIASSLGISQETLETDLAEANYSSSSIPAKQHSKKK